MKLYLIYLGSGMYFQYFGDNKTTINVTDYALACLICDLDHASNTIADIRKIIPRCKPELHELLPCAVNESAEFLP